MGARPPQCDCHCTPTTPCNPAFVDNFTSLLPGYQFYQVIFDDPFHFGPIALSASAGTLSVLGNPNEEAEYIYNQMLNLQTGLRTLYVEVTVGTSATPTCDQGLFIGQTGPFASGGRTIFELALNWAQSAYTVGYLDGRGNFHGVALSPAPANGAKVRLEIQETSAGVFQITGWVNGSIAGTVDNATPTTFGNPVSAGVFALTVEAPGQGHGVDSWATFIAPLTIQCHETTGCTLYPAVPTTWEVSAISGIGGSTGSQPCGGCSAYASPVFIYPTSGTPACTWEAADTITCGGTAYPLWTLTVTATSLTLTAAGGAAAYSMTVANFNPLGSNTLIFNSSTGGCENWPGSMTIAPG